MRIINFPLIHVSRFKTFNDTSSTSVVETKELRRSRPMTSLLVQWLASISCKICIVQLEIFFRLVTVWNTEIRSIFVIPSHKHSRLMKSLLELFLRASSMHNLKLLISSNWNAEYIYQFFPHSHFSINFQFTATGPSIHFCAGLQRELVN